MSTQVHGDADRPAERAFGAAEPGLLPFEEPDPAAPGRDAESARLRRALILAAWVVLAGGTLLLACLTGIRH